MISKGPSIKKCLPFSFIVRGVNTRYVEGMDQEEYGIIRPDHLVFAEGKVRGLLYDSSGNYRQFSMPLEVFHRLPTEEVSEVDKAS